MSTFFPKAAALPEETKNARALPHKRESLRAGFASLKGIDLEKNAVQNIVSGQRLWRISNCGLLPVCLKPARITRPICRTGKHPVPKMRQQRRTPYFSAASMRERTARKLW